MFRLFARFQVCFLIWSWLTCLTVASLTVEERLQSLEAQVKQIPILQATNAEIKQVLADNSKRFELLENEVQQLKSIVMDLTKERKTPMDDVGLASSNSFRAKDAIFRTCHEIHTNNPSLPSGMHWIDPDGQGIGDDPILVYCDMATRTTSILHDNESPTNVGNCIVPGCYSKSIKYLATKRQMTSLVDLSDECHQSIKYDCFNAPFEINGVTYSWWNDRNGNPQYFWTGSNSSVHTCQCGIDHNCLESANKCNCDSGLPIPESDSGLITNKDLLPITRLNFGRTWMNISSGIYTLGRLECSGRRIVGGLPSSCADLWQIGHTLNGLYSVKGTEMIESVYCDFTKLSSEIGFENRIGHIDVKSFPSYFYVQRNTKFSAIKTPIPFELERVNIGGAMNLTTGIFSAPRSGLYSFTYLGTVQFTSSSYPYLELNLMLNGSKIGSSYVGSNGLGHGTLSIQSTINLKANDRVWVQIQRIVNANSYDDPDHYTHFTGQLLQEDISQTFHKKF